MFGLSRQIEVVRLKVFRVFLMSVVFSIIASAAVAGPGPETEAPSSSLSGAVEPLTGPPEVEWSGSRVQDGVGKVGLDSSERQCGARPLDVFTEVVGEQIPPEIAWIDNDAGNALLGALGDYQVAHPELITGSYDDHDSETIVVLYNPALKNPNNLRGTLAELTAGSG